MANKMLIDASHPEETRVVVLRGNRVEEFDFESASKKQLRGNIYLAKVTRVEPSLQAAFVEYGGNRHGFLAFSEIHPDYYQIPVADRQALIEDEARAQAQDEEDEARPQQQQRRSRRNNRRDRGPRPEKRRFQGDESVSGPVDGVEADEKIEATPLLEAAEAFIPGFEHPHFEPQMRDESSVNPASLQEAPVYETPSHEAPAASHDRVAGEQTAQDHAASGFAQDNAQHAGHDLQTSAQTHEGASTTEASEHAAHDDQAHDRQSHDNHEPTRELSQDHGAEARHAEQDIDDGDDGDEEREEEQVEQLGGDAMEEMPVRAPRLRRQYKIQEVIKRRQVLLIQVVKEERGNKGAALTTYLSLAGRYSVLMPNTARGGGISRKITDAQDRRRLKEIVQELEVPDGMGIILRTAGASRSKPEVKRDFEYLLRMWETVREMTLKSSAPTLVYEEGSLIKRSIRDLFNKDIEEIVVAGDTGFQEARNFMRLLMPSHVKNVQAWTEPQPIFAQSGVESQLDAMYSNQVTLKSGGYIVINQTEALVAIDVNSGRSTREHNIEDTAVRTNLEAADEVARQLRLRDLAGLIVVDFIDMEENRNNRAVERRIKDALKNDRARIQVGHISHFGLLEMSRQRIRTGVLEGSTIPCPHCAGAGMVRSTASIALHVLRVLEDALIKSSTHNIIVRSRTEVALYILNQKRSHLHDIEKRFAVTVIVAADDTLTGAIYHAIERGDLASAPVEFRPTSLVRIDSIAPENDYIEAEDDVDEPDGESETEAEGDAEEPGAEAASAEDSELRKRRRRRRRRGRGDRESGPFQAGDAPQPPDAALAVMAQVHGDLPVTLADATLSDGESDEVEASEFEVEGEAPRETGEGDPRRKRRPRRGGRNRRDGERTDARGFVPPPEGEPQPHFGETSTIEHAVHVDAPADAVDAQPYAGAAHAETMVAEPAAAYIPAARVEQHVDAITASAPKPTEPPPAHVAPLPEAHIDPTQPKRGGWWQRAKQSFGGN